MTTIAKLSERILARCVPEPNTGCWLWLGPYRQTPQRSYNDRYGILWVGDQRMAAHRASYLVFRGELTSGLEIDHRCNQPSCVNPDHLEQVTHWENWRRSQALSVLNARKTACSRGHSYDAVNTRVDKKRDGAHRTCRTCDMERQRRKRKVARLDATGGG